MKAFELRKLSDAELQKRIQEEEENLAHLKFQKVLSQLENPMKIRHIRKDVARMRTILSEREAEKTSPVSQDKAEVKVESR